MKYRLLVLELLSVTALHHLMLHKLLPVLYENII